jgi:hypothetical protein
MKKLILAAFAVTAAVSVFAQGTIQFTGNSTVSTSHIWGPSSSAPSLSLVGYGSNDKPTAGTTPYAADGMTLIGAQLGGQYGASMTLAQLLGGPSAGSLAPATPTTTFRSGTGAGVLSLVTATMANVAPDAASAVVEVVAWDDSSGLYSSWATASTAWMSGLIAAGMSPEVTVPQIGGVVNTAPQFGFQSFNLYFIPEPASFALFGLGAAALLIFRRRK